MVLMNSTSIMRVNGANLPTGSEVAVVLSDGTCLGANQWTGSIRTIDVAQDDPNTAAKDGYVAGDKLLYKIWDKDTNIEYQSTEVIATYSIDPSGNGTFKLKSGSSATTYYIQSLSATRDGGGGNSLVFTSTPVTTGTEGSPYSYNVVLSSTNASAIISLSATTLPSWLTLNAAGSNRWTLSGNPTDANEGSHPVKLSASEGSNTATQEFTILVSNAPPTATLSGTFSGAVGAPLSFSVSASDPGNDPLTYTWNWGDGTPSQSGATATNVTHTYNTQGTFTLQVTVADNDGGTNVQTRSVTIGSNNSPPVFTSSAPTANVLEGSSFSYNITTSDGDNDTRTITAVTIPSWLSLQDNGNGTAQLSGNPSDAQEGSHSVSIKVRDSKGAETTQSFTVTVINANPTLSTITGGGGMIGASLSYSASATDPGGDNLTYEWNFGDGTAKDTGINKTNVTHTYTAAGTYTITLKVTDSDGGSVTQTKFVTITTASNTAPRFVSVPQTTANEGSTYSYLIAATDADGNAMTITAPTKPSWITLTNTGAGTATLSATSAIQGTFPIILEVSDGTALDRQVFDLVVSNLPPRILNLTGTFSGLAGQSLAFMSVASDPGNDNITYTWNFGDNTPQQSGATLKDVSHIYASAGTYTLKLIVTDSDGATVTETRQVTIGGATNAPPVFTSVALSTIPEGTRYVYNITTSDGNNDARTISIAGKPTWLTFTDNRDGTATLSGTPYDAEEGQYDITLNVNDGKGGVGEQKFKITVTNVAPVITNITGKFSGGAGEVLTFTASATDAGNEPIGYSWNWGDGTPVQGGENLTSITHTFTRAGTFTLTVTASDNDGGRTVETRTIVIGATQNPPIFTSTPGTSIPEGSKYSYTISYQGGNGGGLTLSALTLPSWLTLTNTGNNSATLTGTPLDANEGSNNVVLQLTDGTQIVKQTFAINVVNTPPIITNITGSFSGAINTSMSFSGTASDPGGDALTYTWNFGDGTTQQSGTSVNHVYLIAGTFPLVLTVTDADGASNVLTRMVTIGGAQQVTLKSDLGITANVNNPTSQAGTQVTYTLTVQNFGPDVATNVQVQNLLPEGISYVSHTPGMTYNPVNGIWYLASLPVNTVQTLTVSGQINTSVSSGTVLAQMVSLYRSDQLDQNVVNNSKVVSVQVQGAQTVDLNVNATASVTNLKPNDEVSATILVSNTGTGTAQNATLVINLPTNVVFSSFTNFSTGWTVTAQPAVGAKGGVIQLTSTAIGSNQISMFQLKGTIASGTPTGSMNITTTVSSSSTDLNPANNSNNITLNITGGTTGGGTCGLTVLHSASNPLPRAGETIDYTIIVTNAGTTAQTNVRVTDRLPSGLTYNRQVSSTTGVYNPTTGEWLIGTLANGTTAILTIRATLNAGIDTAIGTTAFVASNEGCVAQATSVVTPYQTSSGQNGGVESNGDKAALLHQVAFLNKMGKEDTQSEQQELGMQHWNKDAQYAIGTQEYEWTKAQSLFNVTDNVSDNLTDNLSSQSPNALNPFVPTTGPENTVGVVVTPTWLTQNGATNAREVFAMDYMTATQRRLGAVMVMDSGTELYEHTKFVCDRVAGALLSEVQSVQVDGKPYVAAKVSQPDGSREYAIAFVAYQTASGYIIDSRFTRPEYTVPSGTFRVLNFQVWATSLNGAADLTKAILDRLRTQGTVTVQQSTVNIPSVYIQTARYKAGVLTLQVGNNANASSLVVTGRYRDVETKSATQWLTRTWTVPLNASQTTQSVQISTGGVYDMSFSVASGSSADELYISDGTWGFYDPSAKISNFTVAPQAAYSTEFGTLFLERSVAFSGATPGTTSEDYISVFRYLSAGRTAVDLSKNGFKNISFIASGQGTFQIEVVKSSIAGWDQFHSAPITLSTSARTFTVDLSSFTRLAGGALNVNDVQMLVFRFLGNNRSPQSVSLNLSNVRFAGGTLVANEDNSELPKEISLGQNYPNPFNPSTTLEFSLNAPQQVRLDVFDMLGRKVATLADGAFTAGKHTASFNASDLPSGIYVYRLQAGTQSFTRKMILVK